jgi:hypothetical protein
MSHTTCVSTVSSRLSRVRRPRRTGHPISLRRLRLSRLALSRSVRFTNRLQDRLMICSFPASFASFPLLPSLGARHHVRLAKRLARHGLDAGDASPRGVPDVDYSVLGVSADTRPARWHRPRRCPAQAPPPNPTAAGPDGRRVLSRVGAADHAVTPRRPGQVPAGVNTPTAGSGEAIRHSTRMPSVASPNFTTCTISLGSLWRCRPAACRSADLRPYRSSVRG